MLIEDCSHWSLRRPGTQLRVLELIPAYPKPFRFYINIFKLFSSTLLKTSCLALNASGWKLNYIRPYFRQTVTIVQEITENGAWKLLFGFRLHHVNKIILIFEKRCYFIWYWCNHIVTVYWTADFFPENFFFEKLYALGARYIRLSAQVAVYKDSGFEPVVPTCIEEALLAVKQDCKPLPPFSHSHPPSLPHSLLNFSLLYLIKKEWGQGERKKWLLGPVDCSADTEHQQ